MTRGQQARSLRNDAYVSDGAGHAEDERFALDLIAGLSCPQKNVSSRYFYDGRGSDLFEQITRLPEYYLTRTETDILSRNVLPISECIGDQAVLIEFGSGSSTKTEILLGALPTLRSYVPIDVSADALRDARARISAKFPALRIQPMKGDFTSMEALAVPTVIGQRAGFFPGSTIGNFTLKEAKELLIRFGRMLGGHSCLIIGVDLVKDRDVLLRAYNDPTGITARFNLNLLAHANRRLGEIFDLDAFTHRAIYSEAESRIEMHLVSNKTQAVSLLGHRFWFAEGETLLTEMSHKYTLESFARLADGAGWQCEAIWPDDKRLFSVQALRCRD